MLIDTRRLFFCFLTIPPKVMHHHRFEGLEAIFQGHDMAMGAGLSAVIVVGNNAFHVGDATFRAAAVVYSVLYVALGSTKIRQYWRGAAGIASGISFKDLLCTLTLRARHLLHAMDERGRCRPLPAALAFAIAGLPSILLRVAMVAIRMLCLYARDRMYRRT